MNVFDVIIIGAGQAGNPLSKALAEAGKKTALIEEKFVGGTCVNFGCTPTKTMIASAEVAHLARFSQKYGVKVKDLTVDLGRIRERKSEIVSSFRKGGEQGIIDAGVSLIYGKATFIDHKTLEVKTNETKIQLTADTIILDAGGRPNVPDISGLDTVPYLDSSSIMELEEVPEHLIILGGGYIALEFGQMFHRFGSQVTVLQHSKQLLGREDGDVAEGIQQILEEDGIQVYLNAQTTSITQTTNNKISLQVTTPKGQIELKGSHLLVATGRIPNSDQLGLEKTGVKVDKRGFIEVNEKLETNIAGIYAAGDIKGGPAFTHIAYDDFRILEGNLLHKKSLSIKDRMVPYVLFTDPQLGRIGLSEKEALAANVDFKVAKIPMNYVARALELDRARGFMKALVNTETKQILGAAILGVEGGEIMSMLQIAMMGKVPYTALRDGIFAHPTLAESLNTLFSSLP
jgi:pyruvate/2-oxoglutarate dehydrogenase complex dihydrolipoamide dehydrogenase (E3) component